MSSHDNTKNARALYEAYNSGDLNRAASLTADDCQWMNVATGQTFHGKDGIRQFQESWAKAFPGSRVEVLHQHFAGDWVVTEFVGRGTHNGPLTGPMGTIPPTGKHVEVHFCDVFHFRDGKIDQGRSYFDLATMLRQLGLMPSEMPGQYASSQAPYVAESDMSSWE